MTNNDFASLLRRSLPAVLAFLGLLQSSAALAGDLPDPTRPPASLRRGSVTVTPSGANPETPVLQSVMTGEGRKPSAIISGRLVQLGDTVNGMRLTELNENGAVLKGPGGGTTLALTPGADKQVGVAAQPRPLTLPTAAAKPTVQTVSLRVAESE